MMKKHTHYTNQDLVNQELSQFTGTTIISTTLSDQLRSVMSTITLEQCIKSYLKKYYSGYQEFQLNPNTGMLFVKLNDLPVFKLEDVAIL